MQPSGEMSSYEPSPMEKINSLLSRNWFGDNREGYQKAERLTNVAQTLAPPLAIANGMYDAGRSAGAGNLAAAGIGMGMAMAPVPGALKKEAQGIRAYHGSPHSFDKFSLANIGTGEGAQAYGHGLYFADSEGVAKSYRDRLKGTTPLPPEMAALAPDERRAIAMHAGSDAPIDVAAKRAGYASIKVRGMDRAAVEKMISDYRELGKGAMYEVNIAADPNHFLDWDKPLSEQPHVLENLGYTKAKYPEDIVPDTSWTGSKFWAETQGAPTDRTKYLSSGIGPFKTKEGNREKSAGIPGIKYLDAGSRTKGDGSRNYVVFDDKLISIVKKYGIAGASTLLGYDVLSNTTPAQAATLKQAATPKQPIIDIRKMAGARY